MQAFVVIFLILGGIAFFLLFPFQRGKKITGLASRIDFFSKGKDLGFSASEIRTLFQLAQHAKINHPGALFWSRVQLDNCIKSLVHELYTKNVMELPENQHFLYKLFEMRKRIELESKEKQTGIKNSSEIETLQPLQVVVSGAGVFQSKVLENTRAALKIARPNSAALPINFEWKNKSVIVYFTRSGDGHYCFESEVKEEQLNIQDPDKTGTLLLAQSDKLQRTQFRASMRAKTHRSAFLYPAGQASETQSPEVISRVKCFLEDISDTGCAVSVGGNTAPGIKIVVQFTLQNKQINVSGTVRAVDYDEKNSTSLLHIQFDILPHNTYNLIMCIVLGAIQDDTVIPCTESEPLIEPDSPPVLSATPVLSMPPSEKGVSAAVHEKSPPVTAGKYTWDNS